MQEIIDANGLELQEKVVNIRRVAKVVKGGRTFRFAALVVVGDGNGHVGCGNGKAAEIPEAVRKAGGSVRPVLELAGIRDIRTKCLRSNNPMNVVSATIEGLAKMNSADAVAARRNKTVKELLG